MLLKNLAPFRTSRVNPHSARRQVRRAVLSVVEGLEERRLMAATLTLTNLDGLPFNDRLVFNKIQIPDANFGNKTHDTAQLRLSNTGDAPLTITSITPNGPWTVSALTSSTIAVGDSQVVTLTFTQSTLPAHSQNQTNFNTTPNGGATVFGSLVIASNDPARATTTVGLAGYWQRQSEHNSEPNLTVITNFLNGYSTKISDTYKFNLPETNGATQEGDEVLSDMWRAADPSAAVTVRQIAGFHTQGNVVHTYWFTGNTTSQSSHQLFASQASEGQTLLPTTSSGAPLAGQFRPFNTEFGFRVDNEFSNDAINVAKGNSPGGGHHFRFYPLLDRSGQAVPNTFLVGMDYAVIQTENFDFQDNVYLVSNILPTTAPPAPTNLTATSVADPVLNWTGVTYSQLAGYNIYRGTSPTGAFTLLNTGAPITGTTFTDTNAPAGSSFYRVTAVDSVSLLESPPATTSANVPTPIAANDDTFSANAGVAETVDVTVNDTGTIVPSSVTLTSSPTHGTAVADTTTGLVTYTPNGGFSGTDSFLYTVSDGTNTSSAARVTFNVTNPGTGDPVAQDILVAELADDAIVITPAATTSGGADLDLSSFTAVATNAPAHGSVVFNTTDHTFIYAPTLAEKFVGNDSFKYTVTDSNNNTSDEATVTINLGIAISSGTAQARSLTYLDRSGTRATAAITRGTATVFFNGDGFVNTAVRGNIRVTPNTSGNGNLTIDNIVLTDTNAATTFAIVTTANRGSFTLGGVTSTGIVGRILAPRATLAGDTTRPTINVNGLGVLYVNTVTNSTIIIGNGVAAGVAIVAGEVSDSVLTSAVAIRAMRVTSWTNSSNANLTINAPSMGTLLVTGKTGVPGNFQPNLVLTNASPAFTLSAAVIAGQLGIGSWDIAGNTRAVIAKSVADSWSGLFEGKLNAMLIRSNGLPADITAGSINNLVITGAITNASIISSGNIGALVAGSMTGSRVSAGVASDVTIGSATAANLGSNSIRALRLTSTAANAFSESQVLAHQITAAVLGKVNTANTTATGMAAQVFSAVLLTAGGKVFAAGAAPLASQNALSDFLTTKGIDFGNFQIKIAT